jgi:hypothetical protein
MSLDPKRLAFAFVAGAIAVVIFHQGMVFLLYLMKQVPNFPWNTGGAVGPFKVPVLVNQMFWGGIWGMGFAAFGHLIPAANTALRGAIYGLVGPFFLGNGVLVPLFKGGPYLWGGNTTRMILGSLIGAAFGAGLAVILKAMRGR